MCFSDLITPADPLTPVGRCCPRRRSGQRGGRSSGHLRDDEHRARCVLGEAAGDAAHHAGERDGFTPLRCSEEMARLLPRAELCVVPNAGHTAPLELPDLIELRFGVFARKHRLW